MKKFTCIFLLFYLLSVLIAEDSLRETIYVPADYTTIQSAINAAVNGDEIIVSPGTYVENINFNGKAITLGSLYYTTQDTSYISQTIIDGGQSGNVVTFNSGEQNNTILSGFTITNGIGIINEEYPYCCGGGILCCNYSNPSLLNLNINNNSTMNSGGGIFCFYYSNPIIENTTIENNTAFHGGGIACWGGSPILKNLKIINNIGYANGGGIACMGNSNVRLQDVLIADNYSFEYGGGFWCQSSCYLTFSQVTIVNNHTAGHGGGILCYDQCNLILVNCIMWNNSPEEIYFRENNPPVTVVIAYSDIEGGKDGVITNDHGTLNWVEGNLNVSPNFIDEGSGDYNLLINSPCINAGTAYYEWEGDIIVNLSYGYFEGCAPEMGDNEFEESELFARFIVDRIQGCAPFEVQFNDISSGIATSWQWDFENDGVIDSYEQNPVFIYDAPGVYNVNLEIRNDDTGELSTELKEDLISILSPCVHNLDSGQWNHTIQNAINEAENWETLIVEPGTYFENINFIGKAITLGSLFHTTQDTCYISQTIINGNNNGCVVTFNNSEGTDSQLIGFTITQGEAIHGGGINCIAASPALTDLIITGNEADEGGGITCYLGSSPVISNVMISNNSAIFGGGIYIEGWCYPTITDIIVEDNYAGSYGGGIFVNYYSMGNITYSILRNNYAGDRGGGIYFSIQSSSNLADLLITGNQSGNKGGGIYCDDYSDPTLSNVTINYNIAEYGGGMYCEEGAGLSLNFENRCSIYMNSVNHRNRGSDLYNEGFLNTYVDTFTVADPTEFHAYPAGNFVFYIMHSYLEQVDADLYVSPEGNNCNSGLTNDDPLKNIYYACSIIQAESNPHTIFLDEGIYSPSINGERFPVVLPDNVSLCGVSENSVILDGENCDNILRIDDAGIAYVSNMTLMNGNAEKGGGIYCSETELTIENITLIGNNAAEGGGLFCGQSEVYLSGVTIKHNSASVKGGGICNDTGQIFFSEDNLCNIFSNNVDHRGVGSDLFAEVYCNVIVDTFTVLEPTDYHASLRYLFIFDIINFVQEQVNADLYVSPEGNDNNSGLTAMDPFKTIQHACSIILADDEDPHVIYLAEGIYSPSVNGDFFPINVPDNVSIVGENRGNVILDAEGLAGVIRCVGVENAVISGLTAINGLNQYGGGISCYNSNLALENIDIRNNTATWWGGGIFCEESVLFLKRVLIAGNSATYQGGGINCHSGEISLINVTVSDNQAPEGAGIYEETGHIENYLNCIIYNNIPEELFICSFGIFPIAYSDLKGGLDAVLDPGCPPYYEWLEGNINMDPLFLDTANGNYTLTINSPCINAGIAYYEFPYDYIVELEPEEYFDYAPDMGAYEYTETIDNDDDLLFDKIEFGNYPNPFNPETIITYQLTESGKVSIEVYNIRGQKVAVLLDEEQEKGEHNFTWNAAGINSGVYFIRLTSGTYQKTSKAVLLK